ncbi:hypothetical protein SCP_0211490 [Sparassis crispa]|uniref:Uncharacterized protein n=1 Tax=Sparassis crispa TaxID=139825 RepID=A0A401GCR5_9APHY|nr:hypothetical protein SCP_0211490 [Sparassis crispa]GBE79947.1 hypothetical protein SCP_0211490 [Sparassis crispa]
MAAKAELYEFYQRFGHHPDRDTFDFASPNSIVSHRSSVEMAVVRMDYAGLMKAVRFAQGMDMDKDSHKTLLV